MRSQALALLLALALGAPGAARADLIAVFEADDQDGYVALRGVSGDGSTAVGDEYFDGGGRAFKFTPANGTEFISGIRGDRFASDASRDGRVVVGGSAVGAWISVDGAAALLPSLDGLTLEPAEAWGVSADGSLAVGASLDSRFATREAVAWTSAGVVGLGFLDGDVESIAYAVSADGSMIAGVSRGSAGSEAVIWSGGAAPIGLGDLAGGTFSSEAFAVSADGSMVVGRSDSAAGVEAFLWTAGGGMLALGDLPGGPFGSTANDVSADGTWVVGTGDVLAPGVLGDAFIWDPSNGMRSLEDFLRNEWGLAFAAGWRFTEATGISDDGRTIVGNGITPEGIEVGFFATIPEPASSVLLGASLAGLAALRRSRRG